jgi:Glycosyltransferase family 87
MGAWGRNTMADVADVRGVELLDAQEERPDIGNASRRNTAIQGRLEAVVDGLVYGWMWSPSSPESHLPLTVVVDGVPAASGIACIMRESLAAAGIGDGTHAFWVRLPSSLADGNSHLISVQAEETGSSLRVSDAFQTDVGGVDHAFAGTRFTAISPLPCAEVMVGAGEPGMETASGSEAETAATPETEGDGRVARVATAAGTIADVPEGHSATDAPPQGSRRPRSPHGLSVQLASMLKRRRAADLPPSAEPGLEPRASVRGAPAVLAFVLLAGIVLWWFLRARHEGSTWDLGAVYEGGQAAWANGHPERLASWIATPFVGAVMAIVSRIISSDQATFLNDLLNVIVVVGAVAVVLRRLRGVLSPAWWWVTAFALISFGPMMSAVWWHQFDVFALVSALAGFDLLRRGRTRQGATVIGVSVAFKPLAILLPFVLLARRETRHAGARALGWVIGLNVAAQCFMAWRAHELGPLNLFKVLENFNTASGPTTYRACDVENFAPSSVLCQLVGKGHWSLQHIVVLMGVALIAVWVVDALRPQRPLSWEVFAFTCALSVMASPVSWSHYQVMLAPLFVLLLVRFTREGATLGTWSGLATAFLLASLSWRPNGTLIGAVRGLHAGALESQAAWSPVMDIAQLAQYVLIFTGIMWYTQRRARESAKASQVILPEAVILIPQAPGVAP